MTNGITSITVGGKMYRLRFGRLAHEEFLTRQLKAKLGAKPVKMTIDLIYAGMLNEADAKDEEYPTRETVHELCESLWDQEDSGVQVEKIWDAYFESRDGKKLAELNKKKEPESEVLQSGSGEEQSSGTEGEAGPESTGMPSGNTPSDGSDYPEKSTTVSHGMNSDAESLPIESGVTQIE